MIVSPIVQYGLVALVAAPLCASILCLILSKQALGWCSAAAAVQVVSAGAIVYEVVHAGPLRYSIGGWAAPLGIEWYVDGIGAVMLALVATVFSLLIPYAAGYFSSHGTDGESPPRAFWPTYMLSWTALNALFISGDIFNLYVTLELLTLTSVGLVGATGSAKALVAALRYLLVATSASLFYFLGVGLLYGTYGALDWQSLSEHASADFATVLAIAMMSVAMMTKTALFPLHFWLPGAHGIAPTPVSALLSGVVIKGTFYVQIRLWLFVAPEEVRTGPPQAVIATLAICAVFWGSLQALRQSDAKIVLAYSSVAQVGYLFFVFALIPGSSSELAWYGAVCTALSHATAKAAAFTAVGTIMEVAGTGEFRKWQGMARRAPVAVFALALAAASLMGLPPSGGFIGKWLLLSASFDQGRYCIAAALALGGLLTAVYMFKMIEVTIRSGSKLDEERASISLAARWVPLALATLAILLGVLATAPIALVEIGMPLQAGRVPE